jgi:hypothetical protein
MKSFTALHARGYVANDVSQVALPPRVALLVERGQRLDEGNSGLDHGGELARKEHQVSFFDRPNPFPGTGGDRLFLEGQHH